MPGSTPYFGLSYFTFRDRLDSGVNIQKEIDRFLLIDKQLYGLYAVFGNGIIEGWDVSAVSQNTQTISVVVSTGLGIIESIASETFAPSTVRDLPPNERVDLYAVLTGGTISSRRVDFVWSRAPLGDHSVRLARITTSSNGISSIDSSVKDEISFLEIIKDEIAKHKHRGSPSKIDLQQEVKNQLPGARVEDFDASKIVSGRLDPARIPSIDHNDLLNNGLLSHAALDSFSRSLTTDNRQLLGEVASVNLLKHILFLKYLYTDSDKYLVNTLPVIPGLSPNNFIDFDASTAHIDLISQCVSGKPVHQGQITSIYWDSTSAFLTASDRQNVAIANDEVSLVRGGQTQISIEGFEGVPDNNSPIPGFTATTEIIEDNLGVTSDNADTLHTEGFYSGRFTADREFRAVYTKTITQDSDWSLYDELVVDIKSLSISHGAVYMYFVNGEGDNSARSPDFILLGDDEITTNPDVQLNGFERKTFAIGNIDRNNVKQIVIYTNDIKSNHIFWVDNIVLRSQSLYPDSGFIRFRYSGGATVLFNSINYEADIPEGSQLRVRIRTANSPSLLSRSSFTSLLNSGDVFSQEGTDAEIDIVFIPNGNRNITPVLFKLELQMIVSATAQGFSITNADDWDRGTYINTERQNDVNFSSSLIIGKPVSVGNLYFSNLNVVHEIDPDRVAISGISGSSFLLSPKQAINYASSQGQRGFKNLFSVYRLPSKNFIVADTDNDRVIEITPSGEFVRGVGSHNIITETLFYPLTSVYNPRTGIMSALFSKSVDVEELDISKVKLWIGGTSLSLGAGDEASQPSNKTKRILEIKISNDKAEQLRDTSSDVFLQFLPGSFPLAFESTESSSELLGTRGMQVFIGDFVYIDGINHPIFVNEISNGNWIIGNSSIPLEEATQDNNNGNNVRRVTLGQSIQFDVEVDEPDPGVVIVWETTVPIEIQDVVTFTSVNNIGTVTVSPTAEDDIGEWTLTFVARYQGSQGPISSTQTSMRLVISASSTNGDGGETAGSSPSVLEINIETESVNFSYSDIKFSDYTLGSVYEIDDDLYLIGGIVEIEDFIPGPGNSPENETFEQEAARVLENYRGKLIVIDRNSKNILVQYDSPDGLYVSDAVMDDNNNYLVAETGFVSNSGRIIRMDSFLNVVWQIGGGMFSKINDVRSQYNNNIIVST